MLLKRIRAVADEPVVLAPQDQRAELANTHWLSATPEERSSVSVDQVVAIFEQTAGDLRCRISETYGQGTATFYVWHDEQAGQLRCSVTSRTPDHLPFGGAYRTTSDLRTVITEFLNDVIPGLTPWSDIEPCSGVETEDVDAVARFPVWTRDVSPTS